MQRVGTDRAGEGFLTAEQQRRYGRYAGEPDQAQPGPVLPPRHRCPRAVDVRRGQHNRLGFAVQLGTVRFLGTFLPDPVDVPWSVAAHLAAQLGIADPGVLKQYAVRDGTNRLHAGEIQQAYGYRDFTDPAVQQDLLGWLEARTALASERPGVLFDLATARLLEAKVLLPGPTVLARLVASVRDQAATRLWQSLAMAPDAAGRARLEGLLVVGDGERGSTLDRLRRGPTSVTAAGLLGALHRLEEIRALGVGGLDLTFVSPGRLEELARYALTAKAQAVARMGQQRRTATLLAAARHLETAAGDDALDLLDQLLGGILARADRAGTRERLRTLPALDLAAAQLRDAVKVLLNPPTGGMTAVWDVIGRTVSREQLAAAGAVFTGSSGSRVWIMTRSPRPGYPPRSPRTGSSGRWPRRSPRRSRRHPRTPGPRGSRPRRCRRGRPPGPVGFRGSASTSGRRGSPGPAPPCRRCWPPPAKPASTPDPDRPRPAAPPGHGRKPSPTRPRPRR